MSGDWTPGAGPVDGLPVETGPEASPEKSEAARGKRVRTLLVRPLPDAELDENTRLVAAVPPAAVRAMATLLENGLPVSMVMQAIDAPLIVSAKPPTAPP